MTFGEKLRDQRITKNLKQRDLAIILNCAPTSLTNYEKDIINPPFNVLDKICGALDISALDLLKEKYTSSGILEILSKPIDKRSYEEQVALNFSRSIFEKQDFTELKVLEKAESVLIEKETEILEKLEICKADIKELHEMIDATLFSFEKLKIKEG